jgi:N-acetyl-anhydromuramyl-L-alanine amidase AmpD
MIMPVLDMDFEKNMVCPVGTGFSLRPPGTTQATIDSIVIHSTNGNVGSSFEGEANYIMYSGMVKNGGVWVPVPGTGVSAHYLNGKDGRVAQWLSPVFRAWHAGESYYQGRSNWNNFSIGIENHHAIGDDWPDAQIGGLTWLVRRLMRIYPIPKKNIVLHRWIALPAGRKTDPDDLSDAWWKTWIANL